MKNESLNYEYVSKLNLQGKVTQVHAHEINEIIHNIIEEEKIKNYRDCKREVYDNVNRFLSGKYGDVPRIHPFYEGIILDVILREKTADIAESLPKTNI